MSYADKLGIPYAVFLGEDEINAGACSVKELATGQQVTVPAEQAAQTILDGLKRLDGGAVIVEK